MSLGHDQNVLLTSQKRIKIRLCWVKGLVISDLILRLEYSMMVSGNLICLVLKCK